MKLTVMIESRMYMIAQATSARLLEYTKLLTTEIDKNRPFERKPTAYQITR